MKLIKRLFICMLGVLAILYFLAGTETGTSCLWSAASRYLPNQLKVGQLHGTLLSHLNLNDFVFENETTLIKIHSLNLEWSPLELLRKRIVINSVIADGVNIVVKETDKQASQTLDIDHLLKQLSRINLQQAALTHAQIEIGNAHINLQGTLDDEWHLLWDANIPDLNKLLSMVSGKLVTNGSITGKRLDPNIKTEFVLQRFTSGYVQIQALSGVLHNQLTNRMTDQGNLVVRGLKINDFLVPDFTLATASEWHAPSLHLKATATFSKQNHIIGEIFLDKVDLAAGLAQSFKAWARADVNNFSQFNTLFKTVPQVRDFAGRVTGAFTGAGKLNSPVFDGGLEAEAGSVLIPSQKIRLTNIQLTTLYHTGRPVNLQGTAAVGGRGQLQVSGTYDIEKASLPLNLHIMAENLQLFDTKEYQINISPDLNLSYRDNDLFISGKVLVPFARIEPTDLTGTATLPSDVIIVSEHSVHTVPTNLTLQVEVLLGQQVKVKYRGLKAELKGSIIVNGEEGRPLTATGEFSIAKDGIYKAYGRSLAIQQGRLIYAGNIITNPGISLRATQTIRRVGYAGGNSFGNKDIAPVYSGTDELTVGVMVSGVIDKPNVSLFSEPTMLSQADILSYMLFGYPQSQVKGASSLALLNVASEMVGGSKKPTNVVNKIQKKLGLDELSVGSREYYDIESNAAHNATTVNVGRNLGRKLSVHYSVGLFQPIQIFSLRYQINSHLAIQTETSTLENGGDLLYQLESRD